LVPAGLAADHGATCTVTAEYPAGKSPVIVLDDGTRLHPHTVKRTGSTLELTFDDQTTQTVPLGEVDMDHSRGIPSLRHKAGLRGPETVDASTRSSLRAFAASTSLQLPDDGPMATNRGRRKHVSGTQAGDQDEVTDGEGDGSGAQKEEVSAELAAALSALNAAWAGYQQQAHAAQSQCSGYTVARLSCGKMATVARKRTAECQDHLQQALTALASVSDRARDVSVQARRDGWQPGDARALLQENGFANLEHRLQRERQALASQRAQ